MDQTHVECDIFLMHQTRYVTISRYREKSWVGTIVQLIKLVFPLFPFLFLAIMSSIPSSSSSKSLRNSFCCSRAPLQEMPLEQFLLPPNSSKLGISTKRPVSPGTPVLYSPAKRRILSQEGFYLLTTKAPASTTPTASSQNRQPTKALQHQRFTDALMGPDSPVRKLDFGTPKNAVGSKTPLRVVAEERLGTLPEVKVGTRPCPRNHEMDEDCFSISRNTSQSQMQPQSSVNHSPLVGSWSQPRRILDFVSAPRDVPPPVDPQSEHYPGFVVYQDPHILVPTARLTSPALSPVWSATLAPIDEELGDISDTESIGEFVKENLPPRRKAHKFPTTLMPEKPESLSSSSTKSSSVPTTPLKEHLLRGEILTPRQLTIFSLGAGSGLEKAQHSPSKGDQYSMRKILEEEVDGEQDDD